ncbi:trifunctional serine/threonine-protein kinase/ATP-binding protein/sensor histidine kinase [Bradyrhizobium sp. ISRA442]|uniref:trifunctional serine/threonine-protein kinase/ATP-binding protein/sensor histidine kinase n=1 Tax=Bradyrhizobium sp. ISRA442 TaxID=2866197 RepID=UPI00404A4409
MAVVPLPEPPSTAGLERLAHEFGLREQLDADWAVRPLKLEHDHGRTMLVLEDPGGEPLAKLLGLPLAIERFLQLAIDISAALAKVHRCGLVHKDVKPSNIVVGCPDGRVRLTGFGIASRSPRERQAPEPPVAIAGTLAYMAPEQTGRMNRSIDARSDLYSLGITFYQMLTGVLPLTAADPLGWVHGHIAGKPVPPTERSEGIPAPLSAIIMKLLAKTPEERYQTATGVEWDLRLCLTSWEARHTIDHFPLGSQDTPGRLRIPEKLYGRDADIATSLACFDRVTNTGTPELSLISGFAGIGKSSIVNELQKALAPRRGLFAAGKADQFKRHIPYATLVQAFQSLVQTLLGKSDAELAGWRREFLEALGPNGRLIVDLVPELKLIIGDQPPVPELPPQQAQGRFRLVLSRFVGVFARPEHLLTLFLDDLQWADTSTLDLLQDVFTRSDLHHLMLIGAYRDDEAAAAHPLMRMLGEITSASGKVVTITLAPLATEHLRQLIADALRCEPEHVALLADLVRDKSGGNPFFAIQFLTSLAEEALLVFDHERVCWTWDLARIHAKEYSENVVELMVRKLARLPVDTQAVLQKLACLGNAADIATLSMLLAIREEQLDKVLDAAVLQDLVERTEVHYRFVHDRIQEAAYSLVPEQLRPETHLGIGRLLASNTPPRHREEAIFAIVDQLNRGASLIASVEEREQLAEFNLMAGQRAKASTAQVSALTYFTFGAGLLAEDAWLRRHELAFALELNRAECEFLTGAFAEAEHRLSTLSVRAATTVEQSNVACLRVELYITLGDARSAIAAGLDFLRHVGIEWPEHPAQEDAQSEYRRIWSTLGDRPIETLVELPLMRDPVPLASLEVLAKLQIPACNTDVNLHSLVVCRAINLSLEHGNGDSSCVAYTMLGMIAGPHFGNYEAGFRFGQLGYELVQQAGLARFQARTYFTFGTMVIPWTRHVREGRGLTRRAFEAASQSGDLNFAAYCCNQLNTNLLAAGDPLSEVQDEAERGLAFVQKMRFDLAIDHIRTQLGLIRTLRGLTPTFGRFDDENYDELRMERRFASDTRFALPECWYWILKLQSRFFAGDYASAIEASERARQLLWTSPSMFEGAEYHFYAALSQAASWEPGAAALRRQNAEALLSHHRALETWASNCPETFENRAALVGAEIARIEGREVEAMHLYEKAIRSARANDFVHNEAVASELAARFYAARGLEIAAHGYLRNARYCYLRWGALGKVAQLDAQHPHLRTEDLAPGPTNTIAAPVEHLDLATVIKVSQAVSAEIVQDKLLETLMRTAIEQAGAARGLLIVWRGIELRIIAQATTDGDLVLVDLRDELVTGAVLPESVLHYVLRTQDSVILDDAVVQSPFVTDLYIRQQQARSILCLPLLNQAKVVGVLYLENNLTSKVFAPTRIAVLKLLASQAAVSLENTRLYKELAEREARIRRLVDSNVIGIVLWDLDGRLLEANDAFLRMVQYEREDLDAGLRWFDMTPPEWQEVHTRIEAEELRATGTMQPREKEFFRKDGSRVPVLIGAAAFETPPTQGVAYILDLTSLKRAEQAASESERRYRQVQAELAHANRVATMGQITGSIAHEVNQPITAAVIRAQAALRWLGREPPDLGEVRELLTQVVRNAARAGEVVGRIRDIIKKVPPRQDLLEINGPIREVIELTRSEAIRNGVSVSAHLPEGLPLIRGDRVQLQQVVLNLIINAIEAMSGVSDGARELQITTAKTESDDVLVAVRDSGPGFTPAALERIFEAFYTTKASGLGIGLSICRSIVEAHGGRFWASANDPRGALFQFILPPGEGDR